MMLLGDFCDVASTCANGNGGHDYTVRFNTEHLIYKAHFPGEAITPGACILQISLELLQKEAGKKLSLAEVKNMKFLRIIAPSATPEVCFSIQKITVSDDALSAQIMVGNGEDVFSKLSLVCKVTV